MLVTSLILTVLLLVLVCVIGARPGRLMPAAAVTFLSVFLGVLPCVILPAHFVSGIALALVGRDRRWQEQIQEPKRFLPACSKNPFA
jgi:hypothetical protein